MSIKRLERLMFVQGGLCFFCQLPLPKADASIEHLFASANGGGTNDENCVACCKALNAVLGSMSLKEKFQVVLNQRGKFKCPQGGATIAASPPARVKSKVAPIQLDTTPTLSLPSESFSLVVANLKRRGNAKPRSIKTLTTSIAAIFPQGIADVEVAAVIHELQSAGLVKVDGGKLIYAL